jgi:hypothetical protein
MVGSWRSFPLPRNWRSIKRKVLLRDPICRWGMLPEDGAFLGCCIAASTTADHMGHPNDHRLEMLRGLCQFHHSIRSTSQRTAASARIRGKAARARKPERHPAYRKGDGVEL